MTIQERLTLLCNEKGISKRQLEREAGIGIGSISKWKTEGFRPTQRTLQKLSNYFGVSTSYLMGETDYRTEQEAIIQGWNQTIDTSLLSDESKQYEKGCLIPVLGMVPAGVPIEAVEDVIGWEEISVRLAKTGTYFALKVKGDSMTPRIQEGDIVIVRQQDDAESGDIVIAQINGDEACVKKYIKHDNAVILQSLNPAYAPIIVTAPFRILGKVIELRAKF